MRKRLLLSAAALVAIACVALLALAMLPRSGVTKANFDRLEIGMTRNEVYSIFEPVDATLFLMTEPVQERLIGSSGEVTLQFNEDILSGMYWTDVDRPLCERILRWLRLR